MVRYIRFLLVFILFAGRLYSQSIEVYASTDTTQYVVGDYITYQVELQYDNSITVFMPVVQDTIKVLDFIKENKPVRQVSESKTQEIYTYVFSKYDSSAVTIPSIPIGFTVGAETEKSIINTNEVDILVRTLEVDPSADIFDVKAPLWIGLNWWMIIIVCLLILILLGGGYYVYKKYFKKEDIIPKKVIVKIPPYKIALQSLVDLEERKLWQAGEIKEYHSEITGIIRRYFEDRFFVQALEMPSSELLAEMKDVKEMQPIFDTTRNFLENADMVKFAKFKPMASVNEEMMKQAYYIVRETKQEELQEKNETENV
ncbi:MAG: hypothetical protein KKA84_13745 [Bacteroidetes bacterium]|nr:hypothetical protein [Bacteroidota bacterium]